MKRADLLIRMNDLVVNDYAVIALVARPQVAAAKNELVAEISGYDSYLWDLCNWYMNS